MTTTGDMSYAINEYVKSGWFADGGPMAWLLMCELSTANRVVSGFFNWAHARKQHFTDEKEWHLSVRDYLEQTENWASVAPFIDQSHQNRI